MKKYLLSFFFIGCLLWVLGSSALAQKVVGYTPSWAGSANDIQYDKLTHVNYAFLLPKADGGLEPLQNEAKLISMVNLAHAAGTKALIAVGGWDIGDGGGNDSRFTTLAANPATRTTFINNLISFVNQYNLDGVDMDWEYPDPVNNGGNPDFTALMTELGDALHANGKELTAAVTAQGYYGAGVDAEVFNVVDHLNIMAYDGGNGAAHSPYSYAESALNYWLGRGLPASKAILGVPFYARPSWKGFNTLLAEGADPMADIFGSDYYNGIPTIQAKTDLALQSGGGVMIWELSQDVAGQYSLLTTISERLIPPCTTGCSPNLTITAPDSELGMKTLMPVSLEATASDNDGTIQSVTFVIDNQTLSGTAVGNDYTSHWIPSKYGHFTLVVTATDNDNRQTIKQRNIAIKACTQPDFDPEIVYLKGDQVLYQSEIWEAQWWTQGGTPSSLDAWKHVGKCGGSTGIEPVVSITAPVTNARFTEGDNIRLLAEASDADGTVARVEFYAGATLIGTTTSAPYTVVWNTVESGNYDLMAVAVDNDNLQGSSQNVSIVVDPVIIDPPVVSILSPVNNEQFQLNEVITICADATDAVYPIAQVEFYVDNTLIGIDTTSPYCVTYQADFVGDIIFKAVATNSEGVNAVSSFVNVKVGGNPVHLPAVNITSPLNGDVINAGGPITIQAEASDVDGTVVQVEFFDGTTSIGIDQSAPYEISWMPTAANHTLQAVATDNDQLKGYSAEVVIMFINLDCTLPPWGPGKVFNSGDEVSHKGRKYRAKWWTTNEEPGTTGPWGVWDDLGPCTSNKSATQTPALNDFSSAEVYPNPFTQLVNFNVYANETGIVKIAFFNIAGIQVLEKEQDLSAGHHLITIDGRKLNPGVYLYQLSVDGKISTGKLTKQ